MNHVYGYVRVAINEKELEKQLHVLNKHNCTKIFKEKMYGTKKERPELEKIKDRIRENDTLIIESFSKLGRSTKDLIELIEFFENKGVKLISIKENFDITTSEGKLMLKAYKGLSDFEHDLIVERTKEGLKSAKDKGITGGRPKVNFLNVEKAVELYHTKEYTIGEIVDITGVSQATLYRYLKKPEYVNVTIEEEVKKAKIYLNFTVENNNKFVRGKKKSIEAIKRDLSYYGLRYLPNGRWDYLIYVEYETKKGLENEVHYILSEIHSTADFRYCHVETEAHCKELDMWW